MKSRKWIVKRRKTLDDVVHAYCEAFEKRYRAKVPTAQKSKIVEDLRHFTNRVGVKQAIKAVTAVFLHPKLSWISRASHSGFLANKGNYESYVAHVLEEPTPETGESGQWSGPRSSEPGSERLW